MLGGYAHRIARIDLSTGQVEYFAPDPKDLEMYVGGRGLGVKYVFENGPQVDPLGPENLLCIMNGPLSGTRAKMSGRLAVVTKSPLTGTVTDSHMGGWTAAKLKWAGFDGLLIKGASEKPVYLLVKDGEVSIHDASDLWGKTTHETCRILRERHGEEADVMAIGPAGENLVRFANWINNDERAAGRGGTGAVAGSKKLKAIVVVGTHDKMPQPKDPELWKEADRLASATINDPKNVTAPKKGGLSLYGTNVLMNITNVMGALPTFNAQHTCIEGAEKISGEYIREHRLIKDNTCHACPVACKKMVEVHINGKTIRFESYEYESAWALGAHSGHTDTDWTGYAIYLCNAYGMDTIEAGNAIAVLMEATEKGYYQGEDGIRFGDKEGRSGSSGPSPTARAWGTCSRKARPASPRPSATPRSPWRSRASPSPPTTPGASRAWASPTPPPTGGPATSGPTPRPRRSWACPTRPTLWPGRGRASSPSSSRTSPPSPTPWTFASSASSPRAPRSTPSSSPPTGAAP